MSKRTKFRGFQGGAGNNRYPVTLRFNTEEQKNLRSLCEFWNLDAPRVMKLAFEQFVVATDQLQKKLPKAEGETNENTNSSGGTDAGTRVVAVPSLDSDSSDPGPGSADLGTNDDSGAVRDEGDLADVAQVVG